MWNKIKKFFKKEVTYIIIGLSIIGIIFFKVRKLFSSKEDNSKIELLENVLESKKEEIAILKNSYEESNEELNVTIEKNDETIDDLERDKEERQKEASKYFKD